MSCAVGEPCDPLAPYDFDLPDEAIALRPAVPRDAARLLVSRPDGILDAEVRDLPDQLAPGDLLVVNDSKVIPARLTGTRRRGSGLSAVELTLLVEEAPLTWQAFARPAKRLAAGDHVAFAGPGGTATGTVLAREGPSVRVAFAADPLAAGEMPLPPYIAAHREADGNDRTDYQTVFARLPGSVAAPTAGLHFTGPLLETLEARGIGISRVTLHVGAGTFLPVKADTLESHVMHAEFGIVGAETVVAVEAARAAGGRVVAVGTTALRLLETAAEGGTLKPFRGETRLFIRPGHSFRAVDALMTNFHLPRSTLIVLVAAFVGLPRMREIYAHAVANGYRFYSYGDASLLFPGGA